MLPPLLMRVITATSACCGMCHGRGVGGSWALWCVGALWCGGGGKTQGTLPRELGDWDRDRRRRGCARGLGPQACPVVTRARFCFSLFSFLSLLPSSLRLSLSSAFFPSFSSSFFSLVPSLALSMVDILTCRHPADILICHMVDFAS